MILIGHVTGDIGLDHLLEGFLLYFPSIVTVELDEASELEILCLQSLWIAQENIF